MTDSSALFAKRTIFALCFTLILLLAWRLALMWLMPLADTTEARYGEITRLMITSGNWLMPFANPSEPFFAKPAFSFWIGAITGSLFGVTEFGIRLAHLFALIVAMLPLWYLLKDSTKAVRVFALVAMAICPLAFISAGAVMTDSAQLACVSFAMLAAWRVLQADAITSASGDGFVMRWRYVFYLSLAVGALIKGIATMVLICMPLGLYAISGGYTKLLRVIKELWSWKGIFLWILVALPWYAFAERGYPGFLKYFILGEHVMRFIEPGWQGDRYGNAHMEARGMIWAFWGAAVLPWAGTFVLLAWQSFKPMNGFAAWRHAKDETRYAWCFVLAPLLFFTFARNIIWTYAFTAVPAFVWLLARWFETKTPRYQLTLSIAVATLTAVLMLPLSVLILENSESRSGRAMVRKAQAAGLKADEHLIVWGVYPFSSQFYTQAQAMLFEDGGAALKKLKQAPGQFGLIDSEALKIVKDQLQFDTLATNDRATLIKTR